MYSPMIRRMKHPLMTALLGIALAAACAAESSAAPKDPTGTYLTQDQQARLRVEFCGPQRGYLCGYLVWLKAPADAGSFLKLGGADLALVQKEGAFVNATPESVTKAG